MELLAVGLRGYRRFEADAGNLDVVGSPIAIVGPNEVGKTSFLRALRHLNGPDAFETTERTRGVDGAPEVRAVFAVDEDERAEIARFGGIGEPRIFRLVNRSEERMTATLEPAPVRDRRPREKAVKGLARVLSSSWFRSMTEDDPLAEMLVELHDTLPDAGETLDPEQLARLREAASGIRGDSGAPVRARELAPQLDHLADHEAREHPEQGARNYLYQRRPVFLWFDEDRRQIESAFNLDEGPSQALQNLLELIEFDVAALRTAVDQADRPRIAELTNEARDAFAELFHGRWRQAHVRVELDIDGRDVHVFVANTTGRLIPIAERSDGLRQFIALLAFVEREAAGREAIVLVDEAEQHLHYDAQADLVRVFSGQIAAKKIIYTTHSAGCLPHDLGSGVRVLEPTGPEGVPSEDWDRSRVQNWFWTKGPGFSPLLMAMGASSFAFAGTRMAVVAEGISDVLLLPSLFREATGRKVTEFQVAPGLANVNEQTLADLDFVASRVVYLVDRDDAGKAKRDQLLAAGIERARVFMPGTRGTLTLEDLLDKNAYAQAVNKELHLRHGHQMPITAIPRTGRKSAVEQWCLTHTDDAGHVLEPPSERAVAHHLFTMQRDARLRGEQMELVDASRRAIVAGLHDSIMAALAQPNTPH